MPNYCENDLYIYGSKEKLDEVRDLLQGENGVLDYNKIIPYPDEFNKIDDICKEWAVVNNQPQYLCPIKNGFNSGGYEWCCNNWGVKWNASDPVEKPRKKNLFYTWSSPWGPPLPVISKLATLFPMLTLKLKCFERGMAYKKEVVWENGVITKDTEGKYHGTRGG